MLKLKLKNELFRKLLAIKHPFGAVWLNKSELNTPTQDLLRGVKFHAQLLDLVANKTIIYSSYREAARALNIDKQVISDYFNRNQIKHRLGRLRYRIKKGTFLLRYNPLAKF